MVAEVLRCLCIVGIHTSRLQITAKLSVQDPIVWEHLILIITMLVGIRSNYDILA